MDANGAPWWLLKAKGKGRQPAQEADTPRIGPGSSQSPHPKRSWLLQGKGGCLAFASGRASPCGVSDHIGAQIFFPDPIPIKPGCLDRGGVIHGWPRREIRFALLAAHEYPRITHIGPFDRKSSGLDCRAWLYMILSI